MPLFYFDLKVTHCIYTHLKYISNIAIIHEHIFMESQVIFKIDKKLKEKAMQKAQAQGIPLASVLKMATKAFADGQLTMGLIGTEAFNAATRREIGTALKDISKNKNLSSSFKNTAAAIKHLKS